MGVNKSASSATSLLDSLQMLEEQIAEEVDISNQTSPLSSVDACIYQVELAATIAFHRSCYSSVKERDRAQVALLPANRDTEVNYSYPMELFTGEIA